MDYETLVKLARIRPPEIADVIVSVDLLKEIERLAAGEDLREIGRLRVFGCEFLPAGFAMARDHAGSIIRIWNTRTAG